MENRPKRIIEDGYPCKPVNELLPLQRVYFALDNLGAFEHALRLVRKEKGVRFTVDAEKLERYEAAVRAIAGEGPHIDVALERLFREPWTPCERCGAITLSVPMQSYRSVDGMVSTAWECAGCYACQTEVAVKICKVKRNAGTEAAVRARLAAMARLTQSLKFTPQYGICPMASGATEAFGFTDKEVARWCASGCSPECGALLSKKMERRKK